MPHGMEPYSSQNLLHEALQYTVSQSVYQNGILKLFMSKQEAARWLNPIFGVSLSDTH